MTERDSLDEAESSVHLREFETRMGEHQRALEIAERERRQAAAVLKEQLVLGFTEGDNKLGLTMKTIEAKIEALTKEEQLQVEGIRTLWSEAHEALQEYMEQRVNALQALIQQAIGASDERAVTAFAASEKAIDKQETTSEKRFEALAGTYSQAISELRITFDQAISASDERVRAAFAASEKAIDKSDQAAEKRFDLLSLQNKNLSERQSDYIPTVLASTQFDELRKALTDLKGRLDRGEGVTKGVGQSSTEYRAHQTATTAQIGTFIGFASVLVLIIGILASHHWL